MTRESLAAEAAGRALVTDTSLLAGAKQPDSVYVCDDRPAVLHSVTKMLGTLPSLVDIGWVTDGFALTDRYSAKATDLVLIGVHRASDVGAEATDLLLAMHPAAVIIVYGVTADIDVLAAAYTHGARGLLLWDHEQSPAPGAP